MIDSFLYFEKILQIQEKMYSELLIQFVDTKKYTFLPFLDMHLVYLQFYLLKEASNKIKIHITESLLME